MKNLARNDQCHCGSGKKYKRCCLNKEGTDAPKAITPEAILDMAEAAVEYQRAGRLADATDLYQKILEVDPENVIALHLLGVIASTQDEHDLAIELISKAINIEPNDSMYVSLATAFKAKGRLEEAEENYRLAISLAPDNVSAHCNLGNVLRELGKAGDAILSYMEAISLSPKDPAVHFNLGSLFRELGALDDAFKYLQNAVLLKPDYWEAHTNLGVTLQMMGRLEDAITRYHWALGCLMQKANFKRPRPQAYMDVSLAHKALLAFKVALDAEGIPFFLAFGTLLGIVRDGDLLPHDKDLDVGLAWDAPRTELVSLLVSKYGFLSTPRNYEYPKEEQWDISVVHRETGITIDLSYFKPDGAMQLAGISHRPGPLVYRFGAFSTCPFTYLGQNWQVPDPPERFLEEVYGPNWRTPNAYFDTLVSAHNLAPASLDVALSYAFSRLINRMNRGEWKKAAGYCRQILARIEDPFVEELNLWLQRAIELQESQ